MIIKLNDLMDIFDFEVRKNTKNKRVAYFGIGLGIIILFISLFIG